MRTRSSASTSVLPPRRLSSRRDLAFGEFWPSVRLLLVVLACWATPSEAIRAERPYDPPVAYERPQLLSSSDEIVASDSDERFVDAELYYRRDAVLASSDSPIVNRPVVEQVINRPLAVESSVIEGPIYAAPVNMVGAWEVLPEGIIYPSYMAGAHEPRLSGVAYWDKNNAGILDVALGGRIGLLRKGTADPLWGNGWQIDVEGAALPRLNLDEDWDMEAADFRAGLPITYGCGNWQVKFAYYHLSSHLGDEFAIRNPGSLADRINYSRDALVLGYSYYATPAARWYAEAGWAFRNEGGSRPWEFQFGLDYSPPGLTGICGVPFFAINGHLREELNYGGNLVVQTGWLWRGESGHTLRTGFHYYNGKSSQFQFFNQFEQQIGLGLWSDF